MLGCRVWETGKPGPLPSGAHPPVEGAGAEPRYVLSVQEHVLGGVASSALELGQRPFKDFILGEIGGPDFST